MTCFIAKNLLSELVDGVLDPTRVRELEEHLAGCPGCSKELAALRRVRSQMRGLPVQKAPADFYAKVMAKAEKKTVLERVTKALSVLWHLPAPAKAGVAFAASLVLVVTVWLNNRPDRDLWSLGAAPGAKTAAQAPADTEARRLTSDTTSREDGKPSVVLGAGDSSGESGAAPTLGHAQNIAAAQAPGAGATSTAMPAATAAASLADRAKDERQMPEKIAVAKAEGRAAPKPGSAVGGLGFVPAEESAAGGEKNEKKKATLKESEATVSLPPPPPPPPESVAANRGAIGQGATVARSTPPVQPGLYAGVPAGAPAPAATSASVSAPRKLAKSDQAEPTTAAAGKAPKAARAGGAGPATGAAGADTESLAVMEEPAVKGSRAAEPAFDSMSGASGSTASGGGGSGDVAGGAAAPAADTKRDADKGEADDISRAAATPTPVTLHARFTVDSMSGPADVLAAATEVGATPISTNPPALAKSGAYTIVVIDVPGGKWPALAEKLSAAGTLELLVDPPTHRTKMRIEVIRH